MAAAAIKVHGRKIEQRRLVESRRAICLGAAPLGKKAETFAVACPGCGVGLRVKLEDLGQSRGCPECLKRFELPPREAAERALAARKATEHEFGFSCHLCRSRLYARPHQIGNPIKCPDCHAVNTVPQPKKTPVPKSNVPRPVAQQPADDGFAFQDDQDWSPHRKEPDEQFSFACRVCQTRMLATAAQVGKPTICPDCTAVMTVPRPTVQAAKTPRKMDDANVVVRPAAPRAKRSTDKAAQLIDQATREVLAKEAKKPVPPKYPFLSGVVTFPFHLKSLPFLIIFTFISSLLAILVEIAMELTGPGAIAGIGLMGIVSALGVVLWGLLANYYIAVLNATALGYSSLANMPEAEVFATLQNMILLLMAWLISGIPGTLVGMVTGKWDVATWVVIAAQFVFFPIVLLSMLDGGSWTTPVTRFVLSTIRTTTSGWAKLYALSCLLWVAVLGIHLLSVRMYDPNSPGPLNEFLGSRVFEFISIFVTFTMLSVYFRLLGRLAYVIDRDEATRARESAKAAEPAA